MAKINPYGLTDKQVKFANEYIKCGNATAAYEKVYKCKTSTAGVNGTVLLGNTRIRQYLSEINEKVEKSTIADMAEIKEFWTKLFREGKESFTIDGKEVKQIIDVKDRLKASEYLAKTNGAFIEKTEHSGNVNMKVLDVTKLTDAEITALLNKVE